jgi:NADPH:quinone reductase-like Zn-dependent oxidoreductase
MRAFAVQKFGEAPAIHELPIPAADGAFLIRVCYAGVNPIDLPILVDSSICFFAAVLASR